ncbi:MAG: GAF domain-containing protein [Anaerolineales bacterium]|nr:GAF domain-containing protein [Anaerolineales bacterium]
MLTQRISAINDVLIDLLNADAIWVFTTNLLPTCSVGLIRTPLRIAPQARITVIDDAPPAEAGRLIDTLLGRVMTSQTPFFKSSSSDASIDADLSDSLLDIFGIEPVAIIPLVADHHLLGAYMVGSRSNCWASSEEVRKILMYLGSSLAQGLQIDFLKLRTRRDTEALIMLNRIAQTITSSLDIDDVIQRTMTGINTILEVEAGSLLLVDEKSGELTFKVTLRGEHKQITSYRLKLGEGIAGWVAQHNKAVIVNDVKADWRFSPKIDEATGFETISVLCVPLVIQGRPIGALEVLNKRNGVFNEDDQDLLVSMVAALSVALKNVALYEDAQMRAHINQIISTVTAAINAGHGLSETAKIIFKQFSRLFSFDHISISRLDDSGHYVRQWLFSEFGCVEQPYYTHLERSRLAQIMELGQGYIEPNLSQPKPDKKVFPDDKIFAVDHIKSKVTVPLTAKHRPFGSFNLGSRQPGLYGLRELELLEQLAPQIGIAIEKALLIDAMEQRNTELQLLNRLGEMVISTTQLQLIFETTLNVIPRLLPGDIQGVIILGEEGAYVGAAVPFDFQQGDMIIDKLITTFSDLRETDRPVDIIDTKIIPGNIPVPADWQPVKIMSLPILTRRDAQGLIYVAFGKGEALSEDILRIFSLTVSQISVAVENAHLFQQVEQERARLAAILSSSTDAILVVNRKGQIVLDNPAAREVMGVQESQFGRLLSESTVTTALINLFHSAMRGGKRTGEIALSDGRTFFANLSPVSAGETRGIGWVATMQDVSHFKELDQLKSDFVNTVSHDLRAPLSNILMATNLITEMGDINSDQRELLGTIERRVRVMADFIEDMLDVGKIDAGIDMDMVICDLASIVEDVVNSLYPQAENKQIRLLQTFGSNLPPIMANEMRIRQVVHNLVGNAIKYTLENGQVTVDTFTQNGEVLVQVADTGVGIPVTDRPHVFEKFYRVQGEHALKVKGTGLGLAIAKGIIEKHHGRIWLESVFGEGSTFTFALPIHQNQYSGSSPISKSL